MGDSDSDVAYLSGALKAPRITEAAAARLAEQARDRRLES